MEFCSRTIYWLMNCSNGGKHAHARGVEDCMPPWGIVGKQKCCWLVLSLQKEGTLIDHKPNNYDWNYKGLIFELLGEKHVYGLELLLGYQRTSDPRNIQTLERGRSPRKYGSLWRWKKEVCTVIDTMAIAWNNVLKFWKQLKHHSF